MNSIQCCIFPEDANRARKKAIEVEARDYEIIVVQLYKRGKVHQIKLVVTKAEYVNMVKQAHEGISRGHFSVETNCKSNYDGSIMVPNLILG